MLTRKLRRPIVGLAVGIVAAGVLVASPASATPAGSDPSLAASELATRLDTQMAGATAGSYLDGSGNVVVNVTDAATAKAVSAAGATPRFVTRSGAALATATSVLSAKLTTPGTAFAVDPVGNQVVVSADSTVTDATLAKVRTIVAALGGAARFEQVPGTLRTTISGGDAIYSGGSRCSLGFNVRNSSGAYYFLTAGHCTNVGSTWTNGSATLGTRSGTSFPGNDYGIVRYTNTTIAKSGTVGSQDITSAGTPSVGQTVRRRGSTTGVHSGSVLALNATVNYPQGTVYGLIRTNVCAEPGDSGGSLYYNTRAYGLTSGGSGTCSSGGITYFQPVTEPLSVYGVSVY